MILSECTICLILSDMLEFTVAQNACWDYSLFLMPILNDLDGAFFANHLGFPDM